MKKVLSVCAASLAVLLAATPIAEAHVGTQSRGNTLVAGKSSRIYLSLGHGCTYEGVQYGTRIFSVVVPSTAGKPTPEFVQGWPVKVLASTQVDAKNVPDHYTVTWTSKSNYWVIDPYTFFDFGMKVTWNTTPQTIAFKTTQTCYAPTGVGQKPLYLQWTITDGSTQAATADTEFGPAPTVTTVAS